MIVSLAFTSAASSSRRAALRMAASRLVPPQPQVRLLSDAAVTKPPTKKQSGWALSGVVQRVSSFLVGAGLTALVTQYYLFNEVRSGNMLMLEKQQELELRLAKLEKKY